MTDVQRRYEQLRAEGLSHNLAEMFATCTPPQSKTDVEFIRGIDKQFVERPDMGDQLAAVAKRHGQNVTGKKYLGSLAAFPGDPEAWVSDRHDVQALLEKRGWSTEDGSDISVKGPGVTKEPTILDVSPKLVAQEVRQMIRQTPELAHENCEDLYEQVKAKRTRRKATPSPEYIDQTLLERMEQQSGAETGNPD